MIFVPLPFIVTLLLVLLAIRLARREEDAGQHHALFLALIGTYALQSVLVGLRWGYDVRAVMPLQAVLASFIAPLAYVAFRSLVAGEDARPAWNWPHLVGPPLLVAALYFMQPSPLGLVIVVIFLGYGAALGWMARRGPDGLVAARLDGAVRSYRALLVTASALIGSALTDIAISLDLDQTGGRHAPVIIALANVLALLLLGGAAAAADTGAQERLASPDEDDPDGEDGEDIGEARDVSLGAAPGEHAEQDAAILAALETLMGAGRLFADVDLNLGRLARRLGLPARRVSQAINRAHAVSVSHYVNGFRVREAQRLLETGDLPVTRIMFEAGFLTKSNFNREFRRVTGMSPSQWREARHSPPAPQPR
ncbi:helix-turn-helix domain-containing protein [Ancylobacter pratisalsi]|uniref:Helix-turn-helix transcriptional regulator n=1 Tax=Ancylobacter pratisalsi TaxID=1745854 RepID=A0A6P1YM97_9HYPH|nr:AraC family transcriptional regulator [Ancylobacter pratisalsi]QIB33353.1 helix-turn-helix transcriptional regulator [Ancylobacter pratisalsi]